VTVTQRDELVHLTVGSGIATITLETRSPGWRPPVPGWSAGHPVGPPDVEGHDR
jgi:hypothetical protein